MKRRTLGALGIGLATAALAADPQLDVPKPYDVGDTLVYDWTLKGATHELKQEWTAVTDREFRGTQTANGKTFDLVIDRSSGLVKSSMCLNNGLRCVFTPGLAQVTYPLAHGRTWKISHKVKAGEFTTTASGERRVLKNETITVPAGTFDTFKINYSDETTSKTLQGVAYKGQEHGTDWIAVIKGKACIVQSAYINSLGEKASLELTSAALK
jgi:hypothetical protein